VVYDNLKKTIAYSLTHAVPEVRRAGCWRLLVVAAAAAAARVQGAGWRHAA
jgi:hypothetical protein